MRRCGGILAAGALLVFVLVVGACAGDPPKADYVAKLDAKCQLAKDKAQARARSTPSEQVANLEATIQDNEALVQALRRERKPEGDGEQLDRLYDDLEKSVDKTKELRKASSGDDQAVNERVRSELTTLERRVNDQARAYGFKVCGVT